MRKIAVIFGAMDNLSEAICLQLSALGYRGLLIGAFDADCLRRWDDAIASGCRFEVVACDGADNVAISKYITRLGDDANVLDLLIINEVVPLRKNDEAFLRDIANCMNTQDHGRVIHLAPIEVSATDMNKRDMESLILNKTITLNTVCLGFAGSTARMPMTDGDESARPLPEYQTKQAELISLIAYLISDEATGIDGARIAINAGRYLA